MKWKPSKQQKISMMLRADFGKDKKKCTNLQLDKEKNTDSNK